MATPKAPTIAPTALPIAPKESYSLVTQTLNERIPPAEKSSSIVDPKQLIRDRQSGFTKDTWAEIQEENGNVHDANDTPEESPRPSF